jgi:tetratricopeptide (TPR) repeat protein
MPFPVISIITDLVSQTTSSPLGEIANQWANQIAPQKQVATRQVKPPLNTKMTKAKKDERLLITQQEGLKHLAEVTDKQLVSPEEFARLVQEFHTQESMLYRQVLCELKAGEFAVKLKEIESQWDAIEKNWPSRLSRSATEELLVKGRDQYPLLLLVAPPNISQSCPESLRYNLPQEIRNHLKIFLKANYPENSLFPIEFYGDYFNRDIFDIDVKQLRTVLTPLPTAVVYCDITDREVFFHIGVWGWPENAFTQITSPPWNWREEQKRLEAQGHNHEESLYQLRQQLVKTYELLAAFLADWYYLNLDRNYEPRLLQLQAEFPPEWLTPPLQLLQNAYHLNQATVGYEDGERLLELEYPDSAGRRFDQAVKYRPEFSQAALKQGMAWYEAGRYADAATCLAALVAKQAGVAEAWFYRGLALADLGQPQEAVGCFEKVTQLTPASYRSWWQWGKMLEALDHHEMAKVAYGKANEHYVTSLEEIYTLSGHSSSVLSVAFSPDGQWLASGSGDKTIKIWSVTRGKELHTLRGHSEFVTAVVFSPDGKWLVSGSDDRTIKIWSLPSGDEQRTLRGHSDWVLSVAVSPDGQWLASGSCDQTIKVWSMATGQEQYTLRGHADFVTSVTFSHDGQWLASGSKDQTIKLWSLATGQEQLTLRGHSEWVTAVVFSPDDQWLASSSKDQTIKLWSVATGEEQHTLYGHLDAVWYVTFSPAGQWLASGSWDDTIKIWSVATGREERTLSGPANSVLTIAFSPEGQWLASGSEDKTIKVWRVR